MKRLNTNFLKATLLFVLVASSNLFAQDPTRFQNEIDALNATEFKIDSKKEVVVFTGSSSVRMWKHVQEDFPFVNAINTGFGGSAMTDLQYYLNDLVFKYNPDKVFIYEGDNDISGSIAPEAVIKTTKEVVASIKAKLPNAQIYLISAKPSILRWSFEKQYMALNKLFEEYSAETEGVTFVDVWNPMLNKEGTPFDDIFLSDNLHMNKKGYVIWAKVVGKYLR
tara:strand:- start:10788 stop:11456 length:669 start_codon:yes stop_codon:yes gene_type:complete